jgi:thymidylate synthase
VKNLKTGIMQSRYTHEDGTPFTKEEFLRKLKTDSEFNEEFGNKGIDQISDLIKQLKENPDSRRLLVSAWNPSDLPNVVLPPCHYGFQVYTRELTWVERYEYMYNTNVRAEDGFRPPLTPEMLQQYNIPTRAISLMWNQRSVDTFLGLPFNIASYGLLLTILAKEVNMVPDQLIGNLGDTHLYLNHIEQAKEQITREPFELPTLNQFPTYEGSRPSIESYVVSDFTLRDYQSHPSIKAPLSN